ncbi:MAG TPA: oxygenase MpaB family protein [Aeromicrobium sp.]|nr:oxygenase MpaB family protein [Aeromicrobium sp.]
MSASPIAHEVPEQDFTKGEGDEPAYSDQLSDAERKLLNRRTDGVAVFLAGPANVCIQLAQRPVGRGVVESTVHSGSIYRHPWKRFRTTIGYLDIAMRGDDQLRADYRQAVNTSHRQVRSGPDSPVKYNAFNRDLQLWVATCIYYGFRDSMTRMHGALSAEEEELLLRACRRLATTLQVPADMWHANQAEFEAYWADGLTRIEIDDETKRYLLGIVDGVILPKPLDRLFRPSLRFFNTGYLPPEIREALGLTWSDRQERRFTAILRAVGVLSRPLPAVLRRVPMNWMTLNIRARRALGKPLV